MKAFVNLVKCGYCESMYDANNNNGCPVCGWGGITFKHVSGTN